MLSGIDKASLLIGLLYLSKNTSSINIKIPGELGLIIKNTFLYFSQLTNNNQINLKNKSEIFLRLDNMLLDLKPDIDSTSNVKNLIVKNSSYFVLIVSLIIFTLDNFLFTF